MTRLGRTAIILLAATAVSLLAVDTANDARAAKLKKHRPAEATDATPDDHPPAGDTPASGTTTIPASLPKTVDQAKAEAAKKPDAKWTDAEIADAKSHCAAILQRIHAVAIPHEPIKDGACGAPAPVELISIGQNPEVAFSPPPIVRCDLAEALVTWLENDLQPLARKHFGSAIVKIETMSDYSCRNAYGRKTTKLSEHGLANAVDIGAFITASAKTASVLDDWGTPQREILARLAAEKSAAEKKAADIAAADKAAQTNLANGKQTSGAPPASTATTSGAPAAGLARSTIIEGVPAVTVTLPGASSTSVAALSIGKADRLGGPAARPDKSHSRRSGRKTSVAMHANPATEPDPEIEAFLHEAHAAACQIFGTTLGPEANADHRNHFHVDMAPRKYKKICD
ncbi:MAG TPA: extensin family protein [Hyphomicrobium sp.]